MRKGLREKLKNTNKSKCHLWEIPMTEVTPSGIYIVTHMTPARQQLGKHVPERYTVNNRGTSVAG
jgi:hypothetical protein